MTEVNENASKARNLLRVAHFYSPCFATRYSRVAVFVEKILKAAKRADIPVEQPIRFEFVINLKTAKQIGLTIPPNILVRADRVIR